MLKEKKFEGLEIMPGTFVVDTKKFLQTQFNGLRCKSKMVRNASLINIQASMLKTGVNLDTQIADNKYIEK